METLKRQPDGSFVPDNDGLLESCLRDEFLDLKELQFPVYKRDGEGKLVESKRFKFWVRPLLDRERSAAYAKAHKGEMVFSNEVTPGAIEQHAKALGKDPDTLTRTEIIEAGRLYGPQSTTSNLDATVYNARIIFYALGGETTLGKGELGVGREGWDLTDQAGVPVPITLKAVEDRLHPAIKNALVALVLSYDGVEVNKASSKNS